VDGVRLHYIEQGQGDPVVLFHGNGALIQDFILSGLVDALAARYRVIVFDRPGYGYSERPRRLWTARVYATLFRKALRHLSVERAVVVGHSWGTLVALALALEDASLVRGLVLVSGYYYPTARADVLLFSPPAVPVIGDAMRHTISPLIARMILPKLVRRLFSPVAVPARFRRGFPADLAVRPSQLRAAAEDTALMIPSAVSMTGRYQDITMPVVIIAGSQDQVVNPGRQSRRLHEALPRSEFILLPGLGHMVHYSAPRTIADAVATLAGRPGP
jgi:pimeloyl-ACP methyl ester carboxylesterase